MLPAGIGPGSALNGCFDERGKKPEGRLRYAFSVRVTLTARKGSGYVARVALGKDTGTPPCTGKG